MFGENECLIKKNVDANIKKYRKLVAINNGVAKIWIANSDFNGSQIRNILSQLNYILKLYGRRCKVIEFSFEMFVPKDKMTYIILEIIIYSLIKKYNKNIRFGNTKINCNINTCGFYESILYEWLTKKIPHEKYVDIFERKNRINRNSFRKIIKAEDISAVSTLMSEVKSFLKVFDINYEDRNKISRIISELADNACEHAKYDCLIDVDISEEHHKKGDENGKYYSVNICVLNFSEILLGEQVRNKIMSRQFENSERYEGIEKAYKQHKKMFDESYTEEHFFMLASFQDKISGRYEETETGGRGLAEIVKELEQSVDEYECYVLSGKKVIFFHPESLELDDNGWISFNLEKDFFGHRPAANVISYSDTDLGGTGYNLSLVYRRSENDG